MISSRSNDEESGDRGECGAMASISSGSLSGGVIKGMRASLLSEASIGTFASGAGSLRAVCPGSRECLSFLTLKAESESVSGSSDD